MLNPTKNQRNADENKRYHISTKYENKKSENIQHWPSCTENGPYSLTEYKPSRPTLQSNLTMSNTNENAHTTQIPGLYLKSCSSVQGNTFKDAHRTEQTMTYIFFNRGTEK